MFAAEICEIDCSWFRKCLYWKENAVHMFSIDSFCEMKECFQGALNLRLTSSQAMPGQQPEDYQECGVYKRCSIWFLHLETWSECLAMMFEGVRKHWKPYAKEVCHYPLPKLFMDVCDVCMHVCIYVHACNCVCMHTVDTSYSGMTWEKITMIKCVMTGCCGRR